MYVFGVYLHKGGVGKSSLSPLIAQMLSLSGLKGVFLDTDTQGNATSQLLKTKEYIEDTRKEKEKIFELIPCELADYLLGDCTLDQVLQPSRENLWIMPTRATQYSKLTKFSETSLTNDIWAFEELAEELEKQGFDFAIYDIAPASGTLQARILKSVDQVLPVTKVSAFSRDGLAGFVNFLGEVRKQKRGGTVVCDKIVVNMVNNGYSHTKGGIEAISGLNLSIHEVPQDIRIEALQESYMTLLDKIGNKDIQKDKTLSSLLPVIKELVKDIKETRNDS